MSSTPSLNGKTPPIAMAIHGGAGAKAGRDYTQVNIHLLALAKKGKAMLLDGMKSIDVIQAMIIDMENSGYYIAGKGSPPNRAGYAELDASLMIGGGKVNPQTKHLKRNAGSIAAVANIRNPILGARAVLDETAHVMLAGKGAENFCKTKDMDFIDNPDDYYVVPIGVLPEEMDNDEIGDNELNHGTVGAVALDQDGVLAAGTSTGGVFGKLEGRVGDTPLIGSGTWADETIAASCTGLGEYFILAGGAQDITSRVGYRNESLQMGADGLIHDVARLGGDGGVITISKTGEIAFAYNTDGMKRAGFGVNQDLFSATFADDHHD